MGTYRIASQPRPQGGFLERFPGLEQGSDRLVVAKRFGDSWGAAGKTNVAKISAHQSSIKGIQDLSSPLEVGTEAGTVWIVNAMGKGQSLRQSLVRLGRLGEGLTSGEVVAIARAAAAALARLHSGASPRVHGDICASTIWLGASGSMLFDDFGIASLLASGGAAGGPRSEPYTLAPEQIDGRILPATDVFHLGLLVFELTTGRPLFEEVSASAVLDSCRKFSGLPEEANAAVGRWWASILGRLLAPDPKQRPTASQLDGALANAAKQAKWGAPEVEIAALGARSQAAEGPQAEASRLLTLEPLPQGGVVLGRIATTRIARDALEAQRATEAQQALAAEAARPLVERIKEWLLQSGTATADQILQAEEYREDFGGTLDDALVATHAVSEDALIEGFGKHAQIPSTTLAKLERVQPPTDALSLISDEVSARLNAVPLQLRPGAELTVAMRDPFDAPALGELAQLAQVTGVRAVRAGTGAIQATRGRFYGANPSNWLIAQDRAVSPGRVASVEKASPGPRPSIGQTMRGSDARWPATPALVDAQPAAKASGLWERLLRYLWQGAGAEGAAISRFVQIAEQIAQTLGGDPAAVGRAGVCMATIATVNLAAGRSLSALPMDAEFRTALGESTWEELESTIDAWLRWPDFAPADPDALAICLTLAFVAHAGIPLPLGAGLKTKLASLRSKVFISDAAFQALSDAVQA